ncbi:PDR/VanB family oxidoreductase [Actinomadura decatromicini]|uniref:Oxidoreductase n=1 Tax=Actinomadura decatromicini TaxID=2604572 RepID=A0A5D3FFT2_9ACTN|nr:PDR/VanB family oxidoreductase [Actinomadura decatromicini]TYK46949.1 oxidoreductase [Actinomadura decatromicini]
MEENEHDLLVRSMTWEADGVLSVVLARPDGAPLPPWEPGAHLELDLGKWIRQYSLCGTPADTATYRIGILYQPDGRGGSAYVHEELRPGRVVRVRGPRNRFPLVDAPRYLFLAGGIGITPLLPMMARASADGVPWRLVYGGRSRTSMAFLRELVPYGDAVTVVPEDGGGRPDLDALLGTPEPDTAVYCCGPEGLLAAVEERCAAWPDGSLHVERFAAAPRDPSLDGDDTAFQVECARSGLTVDVAADESVVDALDRSGISVPTACGEGICGTCETPVLAGVPDHRDELLTDAEREAGRTMMPCVSRCLSGRLVLDL